MWRCAVVFDGQPFFVRIDGRVWITPGEVPEWVQCTAQTKQRKRCSNPLDSGQMNTFSWLPVKDGYVKGFDYDGDIELTLRGDRYLEQRCELHFDTDTPSAVHPEWEPFDPAGHRDKIMSADQAMAWMTARGSATMAHAPANLSEPNRAPSPDNDGVPIDVLRPVMDRSDLSIGARGLWAMLVSYYWSREDNRSVDQLHEHRPQDAAETDALLEELATADLVVVHAAPDGSRIVSIDPAGLGTVGPSDGQQG
jgi:hypothetical protein